MKTFWVVLPAALVVVWTALPRIVLSHERVTTTVTYDREIVRIVNRKCIACHSERNLGVPLTSYEQTRPWARAIEEEVLARHMPPWRAVPGYGIFANDNSLTNRELQVLIAWIEGNGPKTREQRLIVNIDQVATPPHERLRPDFASWQLGTPDVRWPLAVHAIPAGGSDEVRHAMIDTKFASDQWIRALEFKPGDRRVVRAAFFFVKETGQWLGSWTPWYGVTTLPAGSAFQVPAGAHIQVEIHYRGAAQSIDDRSTLGAYTATTPPGGQPKDVVIQTRPEGATGDQRRLTGSVTLEADASVLAFRPQVDDRVRSVEVSARKPDGTIQVLLLVRDVLAEWPTPYIFDRPVHLPRQTELRATFYQDGEPVGRTAGMPTLTASTVAVSGSR